MRTRENPLMDGPIPGQSLTSEPGNRPWETPPQLNTVEETASFYIKRLSNPEMRDRMMDVLEETKIPITVLVEIITMGSVMQGIHNVDMSVLVSPILIEYMRGMAEKLGVEYELGVENKAKYEPELLRSVLNDLEKGEDITAVDANELLGIGVSKAEEPVEEPVEEEEEAPVGLMKKPDVAETK